ncbi:hypothetical protein Ancab_036782 [Ancistrocladus abbreviatus]
MEVFNATIPTKFRTSNDLSIFAPVSSIKLLRKKTSFNFRRTQFKPYQNSLLSSKSPFHPRINFHILAHFGRPTNRRNSLRKKLTDDLKLRQNSNNLDPIYTYTNNESPQSNASIPNEEQGNETSRVNEIVYGNLGPEQRKWFRESKSLNELESWVEQYKRDVDFWGIGSSPIFTVYQNLNGNVERVVVHEDEILRRSGIEPSYYKGERVLEDFTQGNSKISRAKVLARQMESGKTVLPKNSSVANFVISGENSRFIGRTGSILSDPTLIAKVSTLGIAIFCGLLFVWGVKKLLNFRGGDTELTRLEKEMVRRKMKRRMEKEKLKKGSVEVVQEVTGPMEVITKRPDLDKEELMNRIRKAKASNDGLLVQDIARNQDSKPVDMDYRIQAIQRMARHAREIERREHSLVAGKEEKEQALSRESSDPIEAVDRNEEDATTLPFSSGDSSKLRSVNGTAEPVTITIPKSDDASGKYVSAGNVQLQIQSGPDETDLECEASTMENAANNENNLSLLDAKEVQSSNVTSSHMTMSKKAEIRKKPRVILSVSEAREYLSERHGKQVINRNSQDSNVEMGSVALSKVKQTEGMGNIMMQRLSDNKVVADPPGLGAISGPTSAANVCADSHPKEYELVPSGIVGSNREAQVTTVLDAPTSDLLSDEGSIVDTEQSSEIEERVDDMFKPTCPNEISDSILALTANFDAGLEGKLSVHDDNDNHENSEENCEAEELLTDSTLRGSEYDAENAGTKPISNKEKWLEKNFNELEPVLGKIGAGFRNNYMDAREKVNQELDVRSEFAKLGSIDDDTELEWMNDDKLREIVFRVRDNELAGRDPFHLIDAEDKVAFFEGLQRKVEKENEKLSTLHEWLHSNIENLDYGAEGISFYDPPEKIIPCWKGPPIDKIPDYLSNTAKQQETSSIQKTNESPLHQKVSTSPEVTNVNAESPNKVSKSSKTVIEASDGSVRPGKKSGKEYWEHTKKWSRGFFESYNAEQDPEVKAAMRDIGKDLDRWITEKEIQEAADLMDKLPQRGKEFVERKLKKIKREMELFGPQAVVSKYSEYAEEKEEDYLWWLDLPYVLCIELYTYEGEDLQVGLYSLEMAADLELDPKPNHVIAFENAGDCKNFCVVIQAHMEMLGNGKAFVIAQPPKDVFRQAKANGFGVTVIRKGELELNVDQPLEEVEEKIIEIGSKMYHDKIMRERSVDISSLMKGVFGLSKPTKRRRPKRRLNKHYIQ